MMNGRLLTSLVVSLILTIVLESAFFLLTGKRRKKDLALLVLVNVITNPVVVLIYWLSYMYADWNLALVIIPLEAFAILTEGYCYKKFGEEFKRPYLFSLCVNGFSFGIGVLIQLIF